MRSGSGADGAGAGYLQVQTTTDSRAEAMELARAAVEAPADRYQDLVTFLTERHSYDEPEIVATPIVAGSETYLSWMREETRPR